MSVMVKAKTLSKAAWIAWSVLLAVTLSLFIGQAAPLNAQVTNPQTGSIGLEGTIPTEPPQVGATITFPSNGQTFTSIPITVQGICPQGLLVKIFKNDVFAGAVQCAANGTYEIDIDLFSGQNELIARVFDVLDQPGPDSNTVTVTFDDGPDDGTPQLILTSNFALRGADAGTELAWPLAISGGTGPYAVSIEWGDGETTQIPLDLAGNFTVRHTYAEPGVYRLVVRATDSRGKSAFLQLVAIANGESGQETTTGAADSGGGSGIISRVRIPLLPVYVMFFFVISTFWLGRRYEIRRIKQAVRSGKAVQL